MINLELVCNKSVSRFNTSLVVLVRMGRKSWRTTINFHSHTLILRRTSTAKCLNHGTVSHITIPSLNLHINSILSVYLFHLAISVMITRTDANVWACWHHTKITYLPILIINLIYLQSIIHLQCIFSYTLNKYNNNTTLIPW